MVTSMSDKVKEQERHKACKHTRIEIDNRDPFRSYYVCCLCKARKLFRIHRGQYDPKGWVPIYEQE